LPIVRMDQGAGATGARRAAHGGVTVYHPRQKASLAHNTSEGRIMITKRANRWHKAIVEGAPRWRAFPMDFARFCAKLANTYARESSRLFFEQANGCATRRHEADRPRMNRRPLFLRLWRAPRRLAPRRSWQVISWIFVNVRRNIFISGGLPGGPVRICRRNMNKFNVNGGTATPTIFLFISEGFILNGPGASDASKVERNGVKRPAGDAKVPRDVLRPLARGGGFVGAVDLLRKRRGEISFVLDVLDG
jgi:hypothetical protein